MPRERNIANALTFNEGRIYSSPSRGRIGGGFIAFLLLLLSSFAYAQNSSTAPYIDSWHLYRIGMESVNNTVTWQLMEDDSLNPTLPILDLTETYAWVDTFNVDDVQDLACIEIKFINTIFSSGDTWYLVYREYDPLSDGQCVSKRSLRINVVDNEFVLSTNTNDPEGCNAWSGTVWDNAIPITSAQNGSVTYTVSMGKSDLHLINTWSFTGTIVAAGTNYENPISTIDLFDLVEMSGNTENGYGTFAINWTSGNSFTVTVTVTDPGTSVYNADAVTFTANIYGPATEEVNVTLTITNGLAVSGTNYNVETDDNGTGDHDQQQTLWSIPASSVIAISD